MQSMKLAAELVDLAHLAQHTALVHGGQDSQRLSKGFGPGKTMVDLEIQIVLLCGPKDPVLLHPGR